MAAGLGKTRQASELPQGGKQFPPSGEGLVYIALVSHIEHKPVPRCVEHPVDGNSQLDRAKIGCKMSACLLNVLQQKRAKLAAQRLDAFPRQRLDVCGRINRIK